MNMKIRRIAAAAALVFGAISSNAEVIVIVNPQNPANLTAGQIGAMYLGNATTFPDGGAIALADQSEQAGIRSEFYQKATGRSLAQIKATWARITFTGKATPPRELKSDAEVKAFVASDPRAIGYIDASSVDGSVKAVLEL